MADDDLVASHLFYFEERDIREDGWVEQSINWEDDDSAIHFTLSQENPRRPGELQFRVGAAIIPRASIDRLIENPNVRGRLSYERRELDDNPYHGNLLLREETRDSPRMKMIAAMLAMAVIRIEFQNNA